MFSNLIVLMIILPRQNCSIGYKYKSDGKNIYPSRVVYFFDFVKI